MELVLGELFTEDVLDEALAMKKKVAKEKQQTSNRNRSELPGADHKQQTRVALGAMLEPGCYMSNSGKKSINVLH